MRNAEHAEPAGLVFDQLQIGPSQLDSGQRGDLSGIDRIHLLEAVSDEWVFARHARFGVTQPRGDGHRLHRQAGDRWYVRAHLGPHVSTVDQDGWSAVDHERGQHLKRLVPLHHAQSGQHLHVRKVLSGCRHPAPLRVRRRRILLW
ncbi:Uncharacterised protein [Mycobacterium tuberculosis]|nr:Uncharacterised protein [Mycobacterium tuberculosis]